MPSPKVFLVGAPSGSGKGVLADAARSLGGQSITVVKKQAERKPRLGDGEEIIPVEHIDETQCDVTYYYHGVRYGVSTRAMWEDIAAGRNQLLITNIQAMKRFKTIFGPLVVTMFLYSTWPPEQVYEFAVAKGAPPDEARVRAENAGRVRQDYIKAIALIDHVLLNTGNIDDLIDQMLHLMDYYAGR